MTNADSIRQPRGRFSARVQMRRFFADYALALIFLVVLLVAWQVATAVLKILPAFIVPAPSDIASELVRSAPTLAGHAWVTLLEIVGGYVAAVAVGTASALLIFYSRTLEHLIYPYILVTQFVPKLAIAPLIIVWFGFGIGPKILVTALVAMFPIMISTLAGLRASDPSLLEMMHLLHASRGQVLMKVRLPSALPHIFAGLKVGITLATIGAIVAEFISSDSGLGYLIIFSLGFFRITHLFAALLVLTALGIALYVVILGLERILMPHQPAAVFTEGTP